MQPAAAARNERAKNERVNFEDVFYPRLEDIFVRRASNVLRRVVATLRFKVNSVLTKVM